MKRSIYLSAIFLAGCHAQPLAQEESVANTYLHPYGFVMSKKEWHHQGQNGQIVSHLKNGTLETVPFENGKRQGTTELTYPYSPLLSKSSLYEKDQLVSTTFMYENGAPQKRIEYPVSKEEQITYWYKKGNPQAKELWQEGLLIEGCYFDEKGVEESKIVSGSGKRLEKRDLQLIASEEFEEGHRRERKEYYPNGEISQIIPIQQNKKEGEVRFFTAEGELVRTENWSAGVQSAESKEYSRGELLSQVSYLNGRKHGQERRYRQGELVETIEWVEGKKFGPHKIFVDKELVKTEYYYFDAPISKIAFEKIVL